jgi:signal transduction histidine kinase
MKGQLSVRILALAVILLGLMVLVGWWTHNLTLIQVLPNLVGMRFNTALGFVIAGITLGLMDRKRFRIVRWLGLVLVIFGTLPFLEELKGWNLGIGELFQHDYLPSGTNQPGRMAANTAISFIAFGAGAMVAGLKARRWSGLFQSLCASTLLTLGGLSLLGYATGVRTFLDWGAFPFMALHTAMGVVMLGAGLLLHAWRASGIEGLPVWLPLPFGMATIVATLIVWQAMVRQERRVLDRLLDQEAQALGAELKEDYQARRLALARMAARWSAASRRLERGEWEADAAHYVQDQPGYRAIEWVDETLRVQWVVPLKGNENVVGADLSKDPLRRAPYLRALDSAAPVSGPDIELMQGGRGFIHCTPLRRNGRHDGYVAAVFGIEEWVRAVWSRSHRTRVEVWSGDRLLFSGGSSAAGAGTSAREVEFAFEDRIWRFRLHPSPELMAQVGTPMPIVVLGTGFSIAALVTLLIQATQRAMGNARHSREVNESLEAEARERLRAEEALNQANAVQSLVLENATVGIGLVVDRRFQWVNHRVAEMLDLPYEKVLGGPTRNIYPDEEAWSFVGREGYPTMARGEAFEAELQLRRANGSLFWCRFVGKALDPSNAHAGSIWMFEDIDARVGSERMKREFVSTVSHELRTPLTAIKGSLGLLKGGVGGRLDSKGDDLLGIAVSNCDRLVRLVNEILDLEKLRSGRLDFEIERIDLVPLLHGAASGNLGIATQAGVLLALEGLPAEAMVDVDPHRLRQVVDNLLSNAVKFSAPGGRVDLGLAATERGWSIFVADHGRGIPKDFLPHLFDPFTQADGSDAREKGGTGLGLSISKALVEGMGGRIHVESSLGVGSRFEVELSTRP